MLRHWSQFVPNMSTDIRGHEALHHHQQQLQQPQFSFDCLRQAQASVLAGGDSGDEKLSGSPDVLQCTTTFVQRTTGVSIGMINNNKTYLCNNYIIETPVARKRSGSFPAARTTCRARQPSCREQPEFPLE